VAAAREAGEHVIQAEENLALGQVHQEGQKIATPARNFRVVFFGDPVDTQVDLRAGGHAHGHFLRSGRSPGICEGFGGFDGIVVGQGDDGHAQALAAFVDVRGLVVGFLADPGEPRGVTHSRCDGVNVKVATHVTRLDAGYEQDIKRERIAYES